MLKPTFTVLQSRKRRGTEENYGSRVDLLHDAGFKENDQLPVIDYLASIMDKIDAMKISCLSLGVC